MKSCTDYRINEVKNLVYNVKNLAFLFSFAVISCEEIFEQKSEFNLIKFGEEIDDLIQEILYEEMKNYYRSQDEKSAEKLNELHFPLHFYKIWLKNIKDMRYVICHMRCDEESNKWKCSISSSDAIDNNNINYYMKLKLKKNNFKLTGHIIMNLRIKKMNSLILKNAGENVIKTKDAMHFKQIGMMLDIRNHVFYSMRLLELDNKNLL